MDALLRSVLARQLALTWRLADEYVLRGVTDAECGREPAAGAWSVRRGPRGTWVVDWSDEEPDPPPPVTIAWVLWHIDWWWSMVRDHSFGAGRLERTGVTWRGSADAAVQAIAEHHEAWVATIDALPDDAFESSALTRWPYTGDRPFAHVVAWVNAELMKNVAEIGVLRDLARASH